MCLVYSQPSDADGAGDATATAARPSSPVDSEDKADQVIGLFLHSYQTSQSQSDTCKCFGLPNLDDHFCKVQKLML